MKTTFKTIVSVIAILLLTLIASTEAYSQPHFKVNRKHIHKCHTNAWNRRPHAPGVAGNFRHDLSGLQRR